MEWHRHTVAILPAGTFTFPCCAAPLPPPSSLTPQVTRDMQQLLPSQKPLPYALPPALVETSNHNPSTHSNKPIGRNSSPATGFKAFDPPPPQGMRIKAGKHDRVLCMTFVPHSCNFNNTSLWWSSGGWASEMGQAWVAPTFLSPPLPSSPPPH